MLNTINGDWTGKKRINGKHGCEKHIDICLCESSEEGVFNMKALVTLKVIFRLHHLNHTFFIDFFQRNGLHFVDK
jgi:hypothetical protein